MGGGVCLDVSANLMTPNRDERRLSPCVIYRDLIDTTATTTNINDVTRARVRYFLYTQCTLGRARARTIIITKIVCSSKSFSLVLKIALRVVEYFRVVRFLKLRANESGRLNAIVAQQLSIQPRVKRRLQHRFLPVGHPVRGAFRPLRHV